jgi:hypothetical protein
MTDERDGRRQRRFAGEPQAMRSRGAASEAKASEPPRSVPGRTTLTASLDPAPASAPVDVARVLDAQLEIVGRQLAVLEAANQAGDHRASTAAACAIRAALRIAERVVATAGAERGDRAGALALRLAGARESARPALARAFTASREARREVVRGAGWAQWDREVAAWHAAQRGVAGAAGSDRPRGEPGPAANPQHATAARGVAGAGAPLPYLDQIQRSFGRHDVTGVRAHVGGAAAQAARALGATAYAAGDAVAFATAPDLHTAAHEAAHVVQQRAGVALEGGIGAAGDRHEQHADAVADRVVAGERAEPLLDAMIGASRGASAPGFAVQRKQDASAPGPWEQMFGAASTAVNKLGRVQAPKGRTLLQRPDPGSAPSVPAPLPFNTRVMVVRRSTQPSAAQRWCYVTAPDSGAAGFCEERYLAIDPPEPHAQLRRVEGKETLGKIARDVYGAHIKGSNDERLYVQGLYEANKDRAGVKLTPVSLSWFETAFRAGAEERTLEVYRGIEVLKGLSLWIPSNAFMQRLKASGAITTGSTELTKAWRAAAEVADDVIEAVTYASGFIVGLLEGAWSAIVDLFKGAAEMIEVVAKTLYHLVSGNPGRIKDMLMKWVDKMKSTWGRRGWIASEFMRKWNAPGGWDRGRFQGEVLGWVMMTVLIIIATLGSGAAASAGSLAGRFPQIAKLLKTVDAVGDITTYLGGALQGIRAAGKLPEAASNIVRGKLGTGAAPGTGTPGTGTPAAGTPAAGTPAKASDQVGSHSGSPRDSAPGTVAAGKASPGTHSASTPDAPARRNRGEPYGDPRVNPDEPHRYLEKHELVATSDLPFATTWKQAAKILKKDEGIQIGRKLSSAAEGHDVIARLARGDASALKQIGIDDVPRKFDTTGREWALIETRDGFVVVVGRYSKTKLPVAARKLAHSHPGTTPAHKLNADETPAIDLPVSSGGKTYAEILGDFTAAKRSGITPSALDVHAISDGGNHVIYTRYVHRGGGKIDNPKPGDTAAQVALHLSSAEVLRFNKRTREYWYRVKVNVKDANGKSLWDGELYAYWTSSDPRLSKIHDQRPAIADRSPSHGWQSP